MSIDDRDWRKEEIRQQRRQQSQQSDQKKPRTGLSVDEFFAVNSVRPKPISRPDKSHNSIFFIVIFLIILILSGSFLLYQLFFNIS